MSRGPGLVAWLTGLPAAGKTTLAHMLCERLTAAGHAVTVIDGDAFRQQNGGALGYTATDRARNVQMIASAAATAARAGDVVLVAAIAPYAELRECARAIVEEVALFFEIHVDAPLATCIERDPKGHYGRALSGALPRFTGVTDPYEPPAAPDIRVDTATLTPQAAADRIHQMLISSAALTTNSVP